MFYNFCLFSLLILFSSSAFSSKPSEQCAQVFTGSFAGNGTILYGDPNAVPPNPIFLYYEKYCDGINPTSSTTSGAYFCGQHSIYVNENGSYFYDDDQCIIKVPCKDIGFDPDLLYPDGFCPNLPDNTDSSTEKSCDEEETDKVHPVPDCKVEDCPAGGLTSEGLSCSDSFQCPDGSIVDDELLCPEQPPCDSDGGFDTVHNSDCVPPEDEDKLKKCSDGTEIPQLSVCPPADDVVCTDGTVVHLLSQCENPVDNGGALTKCQDGTLVQDSADCSLFTGNNSETSHTSNSTTHTTTIKSDGSKEKSVSKTKTDYSPITTRQDIQIRKMDQSAKEFKKFAGKSSDYKKNAKTDLQEIVDADLQSRTDSLLNSANVYDSVPFSTLDAWLPSLPSSSCSGNISYNFKGKHVLIDPCQRLAPLRSFFSWLFSVLTIFAIIRITFSTEGE